MLLYKLSGSKSMNGFIKKKVTRNANANFLANDAEKLSVFIDCKGSFNKASKLVFL